MRFAQDSGVRIQDSELVTLRVNSGKKENGKGKNCGDASRL